MSAQDAEEAERRVPDGATPERLDQFARMLDWNLLRTFVVIVQEESITRAANRLLLQQPSVSAALKRLEQVVGRRLVDRAPGRFEPTQAGRKLYAECLEIYGTVLRLSEILDDPPNTVAGQIRIATISHVDNAEFDARLAEFFAIYERASISIEVGSTTETIRLVEQKAASVGLCDGNIPDHLEKVMILRERYALFCGRSHRLYGKSDLAIEGLRGEPYVTFTADVLGGEHMGPVTALRAMASIGQNVRGSSANVEEVRRMIAAGLGIGMLPVHLAAPYVRSGALWRLPPYDDAPSNDVYLIWNPRTKLNDAERAFIDFFGNIGAD